MISSLDWAKIERSKAMQTRFAIRQQKKNRGSDFLVFIPDCSIHEYRFAKLTADGWLLTFLVSRIPMPDSRINDWRETIADCRLPLRPFSVLSLPTQHHALHSFSPGHHSSFSIRAPSFCFDDWTYRWQYYAWSWIPLLDEVEQGVQSYLVGYSLVRYSARVTNLLPVSQSHSRPFHRSHAKNAPA